MRAARPTTGWIKHYTILNRHTHDLVTSADVADEIWSALCYFAEVPEAGKELLKSRGVGDAELEDAYVSLQSFLRQARAFYSTAQKAPWRASPLIYYYAFLNLVKAAICLKSPSRVRGKIAHGLSHQLKDGKLEEQILIVTDGVFPLLYELLLEESLKPGLTFDVLSVLSYCTDVAAEIQLIKGSKIRTLYGKARFYIYGDQGHGMLAMRQFDHFEDCPPAKERFYKYFEEVTLDIERKRDEYDLLAEEAGALRYFETINQLKADQPPRIPLEAIQKYCYDALRPYILEHTYKFGDIDFSLCRPLTCGDQTIPFNEILGIYAGVYFLGSLVRYYPRYFETALVSKDVWMIDVFIRSAPITLLRYLANRIFPQNRTFTAR